MTPLTTTMVVFYHPGGGMFFGKVGGVDEHAMDNGKGGFFSG
jgi:hypothetical protein